MSRWRHRDRDGDVVLTCKGPFVTVAIYPDGETPDPVVSFQLAPVDARDMANWLGVYAREADTWPRPKARALDETKGSGAPSFGPEDVTAAIDLLLGAGFDSTHARARLVEHIAASHVRTRTRRELGFGPEDVTAAIDLLLGAGFNSTHARARLVEHIAASHVRTRTRRELGPREIEEVIVELAGLLHHGTAAADLHPDVVLFYRGVAGDLVAAASDAASARADPAESATATHRALLVAYMHGRAVGADDYP